MNILNACFISFAIAALPASNAGAGTTTDGGFSFKLSPAEIRPGERVSLVIRIPKNRPALTMPGAPEALKSPEAPEAPESNDELLRQSKDIVILDKGWQENDDFYLLTYALTAHRKGVVSVPPIELRLGPYTYSTELLQYQVSSSRSADDHALRPDYGPLPIPIPWKRYAWYVVAAMLSVMALRFLVYRLTHLPKRKRKPPVTPEEDPLVWLRRQLDLFFTTLEPGTSFPSPQADQLLSIVKTYFAKSSHSPARAWTLIEFQERLKKDPAAQEIAVRLKNWEWRRYQRTTPDQALPLKTVAEELESVLFR